MKRDMKLYVDSQFLSPYALSAWVSLKVKGLAFEERVVDLAAGQAQAADYQARSLTKCSTSLGLQAGEE